MPNLNENVHYVKFIRGSTTAWENLKAEDQISPGRISNDTLYFIYTGNNATEGKLYLGKKLISGAGGSYESETININELADVYIDDEALENKQILVYNGNTHQWENTSLTTIINTAVGEMVGATAAADGVAGLVPRPRAGDEHKFLRGDGNWATISVPSFDQQIFSLNDNTISLLGFGLAEVGSIPVKTSQGIQWKTQQIGKVGREITTLEKLQAQLAGTDPDPIDEETIYMVRNNEDNSSENRYDEYMIIGNRLEKLGVFGEVNLNNYVTVTTFNTKVEELENVLYDQTDPNTGDTVDGLVSRVSKIELAQVQHNNKVGDLNQLLLSGNNTTLVEEVNSINERLKWQELVNE